jgi:hypothetical protein
MYAFGMVALLGLAVLAVAGVASRYLSLASEVWAFVLAALGVGAAWLINLNLFSVWAIPVRNSEIAVTLTGILIAGAGYFWRALPGLFTSLSRKFTDQARPGPPRRPSTCAMPPDAARPAAGPVACLLADRAWGGNSTCLRYQGP